MDRLAKLRSNIKTFKEQNKEKQLFEYLLSLDKFKSIEVFIDVLQVLFDEDNIRTKHADKILEIIDVAKQQFGDKELKTILIEFLKNIDPKIDCYNLFYLFNQEYKKGNKNFILSQKETQEICHFRLKKYTENYKDIKTAFQLFYSCWESVDENNRVYITNDAINIMRNYINNNQVAEEYLKFLIRPKYLPPTSMENIGYYDFVFEPFTDKIFGNWDNFKTFLNNLKQNNEVNNKVVENMIDLFKIYNQHHYSVIPIQKEELTNYGIDLNKWK